MIRILKIWVVSGWMRVECFPPFFSLLLLLNLRWRRRRHWRNFDAKVINIPGQWHTADVSPCCSLFSSNVRKQRWTRCSGCHRTEGVDRQIVWIIKEDIVCVALVLVRTSVWVHPSGSLVFKQQIFVTLTYVERLWPHQSRHHPVFFHVFQISTCKGKCPSLARSTSTNVFTKMRQNAKRTFSCASWRSDALFGSSWGGSRLRSRGVSHRPVASPGPVFATDGRLRRQPCGRCL